MGVVHVIVATENERVARRVAAELACAGYDVIVRSTPKECAMLLAHGEGDILVLDLLMPNAAGIQLFRICRDVWPTLPIVTFTLDPNGVAKLSMDPRTRRDEGATNSVNLGGIREHLEKCLTAG